MTPKLDEDPTSAGEVGPRLRRLRERQGLSEKTLAHQIRCKQPQVSDWERGKNRPTEPYLSRLATALNSSVSYIKTGEEQHADELRSAELVGLRHVEDVYELYRILSAQRFDQFTTHVVRDELVQHRLRCKTHEMTCQLLIDKWDHYDVSGILAVFLTTAARSGTWEPRSSVVQKLKELCELNLREDHYAAVGTIEPLASAIMVRTDRSLYGKVLDAAVHSQDWRKADAGRLKSYYGSSGRQIVTIARHLHDPLRSKAVPFANYGICAARLSHLVANVPAWGTPQMLTQRIIGLAAEALEALSSHGGRALAGELNQRIEAHKLSA